MRVWTWIIHVMMSRTWRSQSIVIHTVFQKFAYPCQKRLPGSMGDPILIQNNFKGTSGTAYKYLLKNKHKSHPLSNSGSEGINPERLQLTYIWDLHKVLYGYDLPYILFISSHAMSKLAIALWMDTQQSKMRIPEITFLFLFSFFFSNLTLILGPRKTCTFRIWGTIFDIFG